jgi:hypothetical protein
MSMDRFWRLNMFMHDFCMKKGKRADAERKGWLLYDLLPCHSLCEVAEIDVWNGRGWQRPEAAIFTTSSLENFRSWRTHANDFIWVLLDWEQVVTYISAISNLYLSVHNLTTRSVRLALNCSQPTFNPQCSFYKSETSGWLHLKELPCACDFVLFMSCEVSFRKWIAVMPTWKPWGAQSTSMG